MSRKKYTIRLSDGSVQPFVLDVGKRKRLSMTFVESELTVRVPYGCSSKQVNDFIVTNTDWIKKNSFLHSQHIGLPKTFEQGERIRLLGREYTITYLQSETYFKPYLSEKELVVAVQQSSSESYKKTLVEEFIQTLAFETVSECMNRMSALVGKKPAKVTLKSMTSRWGSCSSRGSISVNYKVIQYPLECIEYVCVHELCHMEHMDHSKEFWAMVERFCPDWKTLRDQMKY